VAGTVHSYEPEFGAPETIVATGWRSPESPVSRTKVTDAPTTLVHWMLKVFPAVMEVPATGAVMALFLVDTAWAETRAEKAAATETIVVKKRILIILIGMFLNSIA